ncbi:Acg family FMN-binding oxidoreductase [Petropleomorpha daqingensis]|uniref:Nitroreductase n=1 Tax=Petropleomorpha daqingensis TaxID=2026353 RepID=A0A853CJZ2_9ACTN|nr:nitroreductase [Petropleomorpha daqingensis]
MGNAVLDPATVHAVLSWANRAPSVHNSQPWRWRVGPSTIDLFADLSRALPTIDPDGRDLQLSCGAALQHLQVALRAVGRSGDVRRLPDPSRPEHLATVEVRAVPSTAADLALARVIDTRRTDRRVFSPRPVPAEVLDLLTSAAAEAGAELRVLVPGEQWEVVGLIERAAVEQGFTPGLLEEVAAWSGRPRGAADGVPAASVPGDVDAAVPVRYFAGHELEQSPLAVLESDGSVLALLHTAGDDPLDRLRAGEALGAVLLQAELAGLATCPLTQPLEVADTRARLAADLLPEGRSPQVLLRLGWAPVGAAPLPRTGRRRVEETISHGEG